MSGLRIASVRRVNAAVQEEADLGRHGRTRYVMTYKRWMSAARRPSLFLVTAMSGDHSSPSVPAGTAGPRSKCILESKSAAVVAAVFIDSRS